MIPNRALLFNMTFRRPALSILLPGLLLLILLQSPASVQEIMARESWCTVSGQQDIPAHECLALEALYNSTNGQNWTDSSGWLASSAVCADWRGVECSEGRLTRLTLVSNNLTGSLPLEIGDLAALTHLDLTGNQISGTIPQSIGRLSALTDLSLGDNMLEGMIPAELGQLVALVALDLGDNKLGGSIPPVLGRLPHLTEMLYLDGNRFEGPIPSSLCDYSLTVASVDYNQLDYFAADEACDDAFRGWHLTQTTGPAGVSVRPLNVESKPGGTAVTGEVVVQWLPVMYNGKGGYEVFTRHLADGNLQSRARIEDKTADSIQFAIDDDPNAFSYFVRAWTDAHDNNQNILAGDSEEVRIKTMPLRVPPITPDDPMLYLPALALLALLFITTAAVLALRRK